MFRYIYLFTGEPPPAKRMAITGDVLMRKIVFIGLVLLALLVAMPSAVSAANTVEISGTISAAISVNVDNAAINFGSMTNGVEESANTHVDVVTSSDSWSVTAADTKTTNKGFMTKPTDVKLFNALRFGTAADPTGTLTTDIPNWMSGTSAGTFTQNVYVEQDIAQTDSDGAYTMTITFTGAAA